ncbi:hypothetical protein TNCV_1552271 [Trichonephila clavipes]|nr:hypothetical protein TNCV_1552271 [Trichonephila clavipes]
MSGASKFFSNWYNLHSRDETKTLARFAIGTFCTSKANHVEDFHEEKGICRREWIAKSSDINPDEPDWDVLERAIAGHQYSPNIRQMLISAIVEGGVTPK